MATGVRGSEVATVASSVAPLRAELARCYQDAPPLPPQPAHEHDFALPVAVFAELRAAEFGEVASVESNAFVLTDNLHGLQAVARTNQKARLVYMDPPYGTGSEFQSREQQHAYSDRAIDAEFLEGFRQRLILSREILADDGSIYVQVGHHLLGHAKVFLDEIFGYGNFRNIITRRKCSSKNFTKKSFPNLHDYVLFYTRSSKYIWNQPTLVPSDDWVRREYPKSDAKGRYKLVPIHAPGVRNGPTGRAWRGLTPPPGKHWQYVPETLDAIDGRGEMHWSRNGNPRRKVYLGDDKRVPITDYWGEFRDAHHQSVEITGYPTEKNLEMLKMIIGASSGPGDLVIDPFCGSGTTLEAADQLGRRWIGMDRSFEAARSTLTRLRKGVRPMGDYVNGQGAGDAPIRPSVRREFKFLADARLVASHRDDLISLSEI